MEKKGMGGRKEGRKRYRDSKDSIFTTNHDFYQASKCYENLSFTNAFNMAFDLRIDYLWAHRYGELRAVNEMRCDGIRS